MWKLWKWLWGIFRDYVTSQLADLVLGHPFAVAGAVLLGIIASTLAWFSTAPFFAALVIFCSVVVVIVVVAIAWYGPTQRPNTQKVLGGMSATVATPTAPSLFYDEHDPNCHQRDGRVFAHIVGEGNVEYDETIYRLGIRSEEPIRGCRVVLADVEPKPHDPGQQRIGLPMRPRFPVSTGSEEFIVNRDALAFVDVLQEVIPRVNPLNQWSTIRLIYVNEDHGKANWFENGDYVLTFRLEGSITPVNYRLAVGFDRRRQQRRWRVGPAK